MTFQPRFDYEATSQPRLAAAEDAPLNLALDGYEGPLHVLLELARRQKIDLLQISILALAEQYLVFVDRRRHGRFELAGDYLVMAAWLAELKSRLLLPGRDRPEVEAPSAETLAAGLNARLVKLDVVRRAVEALKARPRLGLDVFTRGDLQGGRAGSRDTTPGDLHALVGAYVEQRRRVARRGYEPSRRSSVYPLEAARAHLSALVPTLTAWTPLDAVTPASRAEAAPERASCRASILVAGLELVREGRLHLRQSAPFDALFLRRVEPQIALPRA